VLYRGTRTCRAIHPKHNDQAVIVKKVEIKHDISDIIFNTVSAALEHGCPYRNLGTWNRGVVYKPEYANLRKSKHVFSASWKSERSLRSVPPPPKGSYAATYCAQGVEPYITLNFVIMSLTLKTCLPDCVPHSVHESRMKRAPRALEDQSLTDATRSEAGILPPVQSHWRREQKCSGTDLPNP
jgi:hypothetical protein